MDRKYIKLNKPEIRGFTLVEMLVVIAIFSIIIVAIIGTFVSAVRVQRYSLAAQRLLDQTSYVMEYMSRSIRMAKKETDGGGECVEKADANYEVTKGGKGLKFLNHRGECQEFYLKGDQLYQKLEEETTTTDLPLTSEKLKVNTIKFKSSEEDGRSDLQPRITIFLEIQAVGSGLQPKIKIQTTVSQRDLNI